MVLRRLVQRARAGLRATRKTPFILMYHRVCDLRVDPWDLAVPPERFSAQMEMLAASRTPLPVSEFVGRAARGTLPSDAVAVTFDDGYADTFLHARPLLNATGVPACLFLATSFVGQAEEYWWDELARSVLERNEGIEAEVVLAGEAWALRLRTVDDAGAESAGWRGLDEPGSERQVLFRRLWKRLQAMPHIEQVASMGALRAALAPQTASRHSLPMTASEVEELARDPLFEIGGHTATHPVLPSLSAHERRRDIAEGKRACEALTHRRARGFAYPHGAHDADSRAAVAGCGFEWACGTRWTPLAAGVDRYALPRLQVLDWDAATFQRVLDGAAA